MLASAREHRGGGASNIATRRVACVARGDKPARSASRDVLLCASNGALAAARRHQWRNAINGSAISAK
jgi:hypothetical protein